MPGAARRGARELGSVDLLFNNAGVAIGGTFEQVDEADSDWLMGRNFDAVVRLTRALLPHMKTSDTARIVDTSSLFGLIAPPNNTAYCASKFAVRGFSESLRNELALAGSKVGVTVIADHEYLAQVAIAGPRYAAKTFRAAARVLLRDQADPRREIATGPEHRGISNAGNERAGEQRTNARYLHKSPTDVGLASTSADPAIVLEQLFIHDYELCAKHFQAHDGASS